MLSFIFGNCTDVGRVRQANEDYYGTWETPAGQLFVVCDGMGGHIGGAIASQAAVEAIHGYFIQGNTANPVIALQKSLEAANNAILSIAEAQPELKGMGTTAVLVLVKAGEVYYAHIGDSRIYLYRNGQLQRLTKDHSLVQMLMDNGHITADEAEKHPRRNEINKALGIQPHIEPTICNAAMHPHPGDIFLLCTDGLTGMVPDAAITAIMANNELSIHQKARALTDQANEGGGTDNITAQLIQFEGKQSRMKPSMAADSQTKKTRSAWPLLMGALLLVCLAVGSFLAYNKGWIGNRSTHVAGQPQQRNAPDTIAPMREAENIDLKLPISDSAKEERDVTAQNTNRNSISDKPLPTATKVDPHHASGELADSLHARKASAGNINTKEQRLMKPKEPQEGHPGKKVKRITIQTSSTKKRSK